MQLTHKKTSSSNQDIHVESIFTCLSVENPWIGVGRQAPQETKQRKFQHAKAED